ncbi:MAG: hypothetical protein Q4D79_08140 [Propionibacteriaceae bacterium]|nr:hypothetical protein [Propionibacteriaceae bacterium]
MTGERYETAAGVEAAIRAAARKAAAIDPSNTIGDRIRQEYFRVNVVTTDIPTVASPANGLDIPKLPSHDYRL